MQVTTRAKDKSTIITLNEDEAEQLFVLAAKTSALKVVQCLDASHEGEEVECFEFHASATPADVDVCLNRLYKKMKPNFEPKQPE